MLQDSEGYQPPASKNFFPNAKPPPGWQSYAGAERSNQLWGGLAPAVLQGPDGEQNWDVQDFAFLVKRPGMPRNVRKLCLSLREEIHGEIPPALRQMVRQLCDHEETLGKMRNELIGTESGLRLIADLEFRKSIPPPIHCHAAKRSRSSAAWTPSWRRCGR